MQIERQILGGSLKFLPFTVHHFKYDLYSVVLLHVSFSCSRRNTKSLKFTLFKRGLMGICLFNPLTDAFALGVLLVDPAVSSLGFLRGPIACKALLILLAWDLLFLHDSLQHVKVIPVLVLRVSYVRFYLDLPKILIVLLHLAFIFLRGSEGGCAPHSFLSTKRTEVTIIPEN
ncbi:hypothetical protein ALC60_01732 [Trachymyrmex zeteki]|uniref:Uncharacterized protein n=1 Tax=Mycetomoellerius zeteki TaxID=64791 RepID=A0A151XFL2_9HYME|nr:hypothetical protein ALC60_01732 [Trachymyrmex zeteki]